MIREVPIFYLRIETIINCKEKRVEMKRLKLCSLLVVLFIAGCQSATQSNQAAPVNSTIEIKEHDGTMSDILQIGRAHV